MDVGNITDTLGQHPLVMLAGAVALGLLIMRGRGTSTSPAAQQAALQKQIDAANQAASAKGVTYVSTDVLNTALAQQRATLEAEFSDYQNQQPYRALDLGTAQAQITSSTLPPAGIPYGIAGE